ncbi:C10 family peptidase [bacterium]|nr:C10 family peptidase [bacterium]
MQKKLLSILIPILLIPSVLTAEKVAKNDAKRAATAWLHRSPAFVRSGQSYGTAAEMIAISDSSGSEIIAYTLNLEPRGFVVITADDRLNPVIAYSEYSVFDTTESAENILLSLLRKDIPQRMGAVNKGLIGSSALEAHRQNWNISLEMVDPAGRILQKPVVQTTYASEYGPFLTSQWGQTTDGSNYTFNYFTPNYDPCGCVATAMGQILNYYRWPLTGSGSHSYNWDNGVEDPAVLSADFGTTFYDWDNILDIYLGAGAGVSERQAVGELTYHCGVAVDMNYSSSGSGAFTSDVAPALSEYFRARGEYVKNTGDFYTRLRTNMENSRPAELSISGSYGGHAVVVDGFRDTGGSDEYHLNMGWYGTSDAWYVLPDVNSSPYSFTVVNGAVLDIVPSPDVTDPGTTTTAHSITVSWNTARNNPADYYKLERAFVSGETATCFDGLEAGAGGWRLTGTWNLTDTQSKTGDYSLRGYVNNVTNGTAVLEQAVYVTETTAVTYDYGAYYHKNAEIRLEVSEDGVGWTAVKTYSPYNDGSSIVWTVESSIDLSPYIGTHIFFRFVIDEPMGSYWNGDAYSDVGFFVDNFTVTGGSCSGWTTIAGSTLSTSYTDAADANGTYLYRCSAYQDGFWSNVSDVELISRSSPLVELRLFLEGPYDADGDTMYTALQSGGYIPLTAPYSEDARTVASVPEGITDWVLVQLRSTVDGSAIDSRSAFLRNDGRIVSENGDTQLMMDAAEGYYYLVVRHRNHLAVMSPDSIALSASGSTVYDFSEGLSRYRGGDAALLESGVYGLYSGDASGNQQVQNDDKNDFWKAQVGVSGYRAADFNLNGQVQNDDKNDFWKANVGKGSQVSNL